MDIRINQDKWGRKRVPLIEKLGESAKKRGWTINLSKKGNKYALSDNKKEYWMKLSKGKEIRFIEVMSNHVHYHIDINHKEPENKW